MIHKLHSFDLKNKRILMRVDFNVPISAGKVAEDHRLRSALPTIEYCLEQGAGLVLMSHLGRPKGYPDPALSLMPVGESLADLLEMPIKFSADCVSEDALDTSLGIGHGEIHLLENLRFHNEESKNDPFFSIQLAKHGEVYINDAFGTAHRAHASNVGVVEHFKQKGIGLLMEKELEFLQETFHNPKRPVLIMLGGAKIDTKLSLINRFLDVADTIIIGGGMAFTFLKAKGREIGGSLFEENMLPIAEKILREVKNHKARLIFPVDFVCGEKIDGNPLGTFSGSEIPSNLKGFDIGPKSIKNFQKYILSSKTILWNGPMGVFENEVYAMGTKSIAGLLALATNSGSKTIVGGGDTASAISSFGLENKVTHVSTGGGASLALLSGEHLPALRALE